MFDLYKWNKSKSNNFYANLGGKGLTEVAFGSSGHSILTLQASSTVSVSQGLFKMGKLITV